MTLLTFDHILYAVPDLQKGIKDFENLTGIRPEYGGKHPTLGTHNALVSLGEGIYFELIARDPSTTIKPNDILFGIGVLDQPKIVTWSVRTDNIQQLQHQGVIEQIQNGGRQKEDGSQLKWQTAEISNIADKTGLVPFVIDWKKTPHPSHSAPQGCQLLEFSAKHPMPEKFSTLQSLFQFSFKIHKGEPFQLTLKLKSPKGIIKIC